VDAAFDDTLRTGRFRRGNPNVGFEDATQYEFSLRTRPSASTTLRVNVFNKLLDGLVVGASGPRCRLDDLRQLRFWERQRAELIFERGFTGTWGARVAYTLQKAEATATNAFELVHRIRIGPTGDTINPRVCSFRSTTTAATLSR